MRKYTFQICRTTLALSTELPLVTGGPMERFLASDPPSRVNITLYGASPETYGALCGDPSAYERAVRTILGLRAAGVLVKLNFSVTPYNRRDLPAAYQFAREHGLHIQAASYMFPPVRACEHGCFQADRLTPEESAGAQLDYDCLRFPPEELRPRLERLLAGGHRPRPGPGVSGAAHGAHPLPRGQQHLLGHLGRAAAPLRDGDRPHGGPGHPELPRRLGEHPRRPGADHGAARLQRVPGAERLRPVLCHLSGGDGGLYRRPGVYVPKDPGLPGAWPEVAGGAGGAGGVRKDRGETPLPPGTEHFGGKYDESFKGIYFA